MIGSCFITFEGLDGCGKTTQLNLFADWLRTFDRSYPIWTTAQPGYGITGSRIKKIILDPLTRMSDLAELFLYLADRANHAVRIREHLSHNGIVICDRYTDSTIAYQGYGKGLDLDMVDYLNAIASNRIEPDLTFWIDLDPEQSLLRAKATSDYVGGDRMESQGIEFFNLVHRGYTCLAQDNPRIKRIDGGKGIGEVQAQIRQVFLDNFKR